jgi:hypothetical protein
MEKRELVNKVVTQSSVYVPFDGESIRITSCFYEPGHGEAFFVGEGDESGDCISVEYDDVDLDNDMFYALTLLDVAQIQQAEII